VLIYGNLGAPRLELLGAGWATLITRTITFIALAIIIFRHRTFAQYIGVRREQWKLRMQTIKELLAIGVPSSLQIGMEAGAFAVSGILIGTISAVAQAAHQIALSCAAFTFMVSMGLAQAGSIRVSNAYGQGKWDKILAIGKSTLVVALLYGIFCAIGFTLFRWTLAALFNKDATVLQLAATLLLFAAVFQISDATQAIGAGLLRGIKDVKTPTWLIFIAYWVIGLPIGCLLGFTYGMGAQGMWLGLILGLTFASLFLVRRFFKMAKRRIA
jgi:MATE family multidrug resistance protein